MGGTCASLLENVGINRCSRYLNAYGDNPAISHKMLTLELRKLEDAGIVVRSEFEGYPLRVEYDLTPAGLNLVPLLDALGDWWHAASVGRSQGILQARVTE